MSTLPYEQEIQLRLGRGNRKVGLAWTFSLPSRTTCPGASPWCLEHCYATRIERLRVHCRRAYLENLVLSIDADAFVASMLDALPEDAEVLRIHVGGDLHSATYIHSWVEICKARPGTQFWAYTRSWTVPELREPLEALRALPNVALFASVDATMPLPPEGWRRAFVADDPRAQGLACPQQQDRVESCMACRHCFPQGKGDVVFKVH
jgi:hypothetical protein